MSQSDASGPGTVTTEVTLHGDEWELKARVTVPAGPATLTDLLPLARTLADTVVDATRQEVERAGTAVSCRAGCGACCRNLVAISGVEARRLHQLLLLMPAERRAHVRARFDAARQTLQSAGLLEPLLDTTDWTEDDYDERYHRYFRLGLACPFLENESCSIYEERPITCREYLVTSSPGRCAQPETGPITRVVLPLRVFNAVARWQAPPSRHLNERWVPLVTALEWAEQHPDDPPPKPGKELLRQLLVLLSEKPGGSGEPPD
jgi:Fe-S-cluster containining protein